MNFSSDHVEPIKADRGTHLHPRPLPLFSFSLYFRPAYWPLSILSCLLPPLFSTSLILSPLVDPLFFPFVASLLFFPLSLSPSCPSSSLFSVASYPCQRLLILGIRILCSLSFSLCFTHTHTHSLSFSVCGGGLRRSLARSLARSLQQLVGFFRVTRRCNLFGRARYGRGGGRGTTTRPGGVALCRVCGEVGRLEGGIAGGGRGERGGHGGGGDAARMRDQGMGNERTLPDAAARGRGGGGGGFSLFCGIPAK